MRRWHFLTQEIQWVTGLMVLGTGSIWCSKKTSLVGFWIAPNWFGVITIVIIGLCISENSTVGLKRLVPVFDLWKSED